MNDDTRTVSKWEFVPSSPNRAEHATVVVPIALDHPFAYLLSSLYICALVLPRVSFCSFRHLFPNIYYLVFQKFRPLFVPFFGLRGGLPLGDTEGISTCADLAGETIGKFLTRTPSPLPTYTYSSSVISRGDISRLPAQSHNHFVHAS